MEGNVQSVCVGIATRDRQIIIVTLAVYVSAGVSAEKLMLEEFHLGHGCPALLRLAPAMLMLTPAMLVLTPAMLMLTPAMLVLTPAILSIHYYSYTDP